MQNQSFLEIAKVFTSGFGAAALTLPRLQRLEPLSYVGDVLLALENG